jgi:hypothetical protein
MLDWQSLRTWQASTLSRRTKAYEHEEACNACLGSKLLITRERDIFFLRKDHQSMYRDTPRNFFAWERCLTTVQRIKVRHCTRIIRAEPITSTVGALLIVSCCYILSPTLHRGSTLWQACVHEFPSHSCHTFSSVTSIEICLARQWCWSGGVTSYLFIICVERRCGLAHTLCRWRLHNIKKMKQSVYPINYDCPN